MIRSISALTLAAIIMAAVSLHADVPERTAYQGRLTDNLGNPLNGSYDLTFRIYDDSTGGAMLYEETHVGVVVTDGLFSVLIGGLSFITPFNDFLFVGKDRFLGVQVSADPEISPRTRLVTSPYAFRVSTVDSASGGTISGKLKVTGDAVAMGDMGVGTEFPAAGSGSISRVLQVEAPAGPSAGAAVSLKDGGAGNTWDLVATPSTGVFGLFGNGTGLFYVEANGDVGLGTPSPSTGVVNVASRVLEINAPLAGANNSGAAITLVDGNLGYAWDIIATSSAGNNLVIYSNGNGRVYLEPNGDLGLGSITPSTGAVNVASRVLEIQAPFNAANNSGAALTLTDGSFGSSWDVIATSANGGLGIYGNNNQVMYMKPTGEVGIGTSNPAVELHVAGDICYTGSIGACSDARFKTDVQELSSSLDKITQLRGVTYHWRSDEYPDRKFDNREHLGFIAQEVEAMFPNMVMTDDEGYKSVDYGRLTPVLVEAIKEQQKQIEALKAKADQVTAMESELAQLKTLVQQLASQVGVDKNAKYGMK